MSKKFIIVYNSQLRLGFDLFVVVLALFTCFEIPIRFSFGTQFYSNEGIEIVHMVDHVVDGVFFIEIVLNFFTSYINIKSGLEVTEHKQIAKNYIKLHFWLDLLSTLPYELAVRLKLGIDYEEMHEYFYILGALKLTRLLRIRKIFGFIKFA